MTRTEDCPFCDLHTKEPAPFDVSTPIDEVGDVILKPDKGMLMPGYLLAVTSKHLTSFAQLQPERLAAVDNRLSLYEQELQKRFGQYFRLEHGSDNVTQAGSGSCIDHAHMHLVPADEDVGPVVQEALPWEQIESYADLAEFRGRPYVYLGRLASHFVVPEPKLPGQWVRRQIAVVRGLDHWDWAVCSSSDELQETLVKLEDFPLVIFQGADIK